MRICNYSIGQDDKERIIEALGFWSREWIEFVSCVLLYYRCSNSYTGHVGRQVVLVSRHSWKSFLSSRFECLDSSADQFLLSPLDTFHCVFDSCTFDRLIKDIIRFYSFGIWRFARLRCWSAIISFSLILENGILEIQVLHCKLIKVYLLIVYYD